MHIILKTMRGDNMISRLFCAHCEKYYKVDVENIKLVQERMGSNLRYANNTYYYEDGCFFKDLNKVKNSKNEEQ